MTGVGGKILVTSYIGYNVVGAGGGIPNTGECSVAQVLDGAFEIKCDVAPLNGSTLTVIFIP